MNHNKHDAGGWKKRAGSRKNNMKLESERQERNSVKSIEPVGTTTIRVVKIDGTVKIFEVKKQQ